MGDIHKAFVTAYADMDNPKKNANNPAFRSKYANLEEVLSVIRPLLAAVGLAITQEPVSEDGRIGVHTQVVGQDGDLIDFGYFTVPLSKNDAQGAGSAITYCRRYALTSIFGLAQEDDDGNAASKPQVKHTPKPQPEVESKPQPAPEARKDAEADKPASGAQVRKIWAMAGEAGWPEATVKHACTEYGAADPTELSSFNASRLIDRMKTAKEKQDAVAKKLADDFGATEVTA